MNAKRTPRRPAPATAPEAQQGRSRGVARDEKNKRLIKRHPQRDIPMVEGIEPAEAPRKE